MALLTLSNISKGYGARSVLQGVSLQLQHGEKAGLIGPNGSGKTTLVKIIAGELDADSGTANISRGTRTGYLPQGLNRVGAGSLRSCLEEPLRGLLQVKQEIASLEQEIAASAREENGGLNRLLERYGALTSRFEDEGGYWAENRILAVARGLGFAPADLERRLDRFSGGEKTRALLAALLLQEPDLLLLDEPTNFLDLEALEWLERYLREWPRALLVVSHDRFFLDRVTNRIFALSGGKLKSYSGNYSAYLARYQQERAGLERACRQRQTLVSREETLIRESKADERSKRQARSREKRLAKMEPVEHPAREKTFRPGFGFTGRSGRKVLVCDAVTKSYGVKTLLRDFSLEIYWGDRVALVGPNGAGKSTLLKLIAGQERPDRGEIRLGPAVKVTYFAQEQELLNPENAVLEEITAATGLDLKQARNHLGRYLFRGDDVFKKVKDLSGGEKSRLALARLALGSGNCLLMDEPTSHLDLPALEELEAALASYPGTLIVVSHDRYFLNNIAANRVLELGGGACSIFDGDFQSFQQRREQGARPEPGAAAEAPGRPKERERELRRERQQRERREKQLQSEQTNLEQGIASVEAEIARLERMLSDPAQYGDFHRLRELGEQLEAGKNELAALLDRWEEVARLLDSEYGAQK